MSEVAAPSAQRSPWLLKYRLAAVLAVHWGLWSLSLVLAFQLRFEFEIPDAYFPVVFRWWAIDLVLRTLAFAWFGLFSGMWRYTGSRDLTSLVKATALSTASLAAALWWSEGQGFPRSIYVIDWLLTLVLVGGLRFFIRTMAQVAAQSLGGRTAKTRLLIVGAGNAGEMLLREIQKTYANRYSPVGFVDDNPTKKGQSIHGVPVLGSIAEVPDLVERHAVDEIVLAVPSAKGVDLRRIVERCAVPRASLRTLPSLDEVIEGRVSISTLRQVAIEDLLRREPVQLDEGALVSFLGKRCLMVTGAGGSIGSELCRQLARFGPQRVVLVERAENALFEIHRELLAQHPGIQWVPALADVGDSPRMGTLFAEHRPTVVLHAAAHKHVPLMEANPLEALKNNVGGTQRVAALALEHQVEHFVMISTDKAVNPTSVMGASKRMAELCIQGLAEQKKTKFVAVRFGNVLGSNGSVVPIFKEQIAKGGPVTVTHPEMRRYFMTIPEACQLVLQAGSMGKGGEIFVLDMGEPVKILDLATDLIALSGLRPHVDIEIQFTGMRPGEKLFEELNLSDEGAVKTVHPRIWVGKLQGLPASKVQEMVEGLKSLAVDASPEQIRRWVSAYVPEYRPGE